MPTVAEKLYQHSGLLLLIMFICSFSTQVPQIPTTNPTPKNYLKKYYLIIIYHIGLDYMASDIDQPALDYLLTSQRAEVVIKKLKIGEKSYKYERSKPLSGKLMMELKKARQKNELQTI